MKYYTTYLSINCESPRAGTPMSFNSPDPPFSSHLKRLGAIIQREGGGVKVIIREKGGKCASVLIHLSACVASICTGCSKVFIFSAIPVLHLFICFVNAITRPQRVPEGTRYSVFKITTRTLLEIFYLLAE